MSKTIHYSLISEPHLLDLVDEEWRKDKLPDDSVPLPQGIAPPSDEADEQQPQQEKKKDRWDELGLQDLQ